MPTAVVEPRLRELIAIRIAELNGASNSLVHHARAALELGESPSRLTALARWRSSSTPDTVASAWDRLELAAGAAGP